MIHLCALSPLSVLSPPMHHIGRYDLLLMMMSALANALRSIIVCVSTNNMRAHLLWLVRSRTKSLSDAHRMINRINCAQMKISWPGRSKSVLGPLLINFIELYRWMRRATTNSICGLGCWIRAVRTSHDITSQPLHTTDIRIWCEREVNAPTTDSNSIAIVTNTNNRNTRRHKYRIHWALTDFVEPSLFFFQVSNDLYGILRPVEQ